MVSQPGSVGYTIMGKKAIDALKKEDKPQSVTAKEVGCSQSAVSKHILRKLSERKKPVRKSLHLETGITSVLTGLASKIHSSQQDLVHALTAKRYQKLLQ
ncbi:hypothetical protein CHARACLAT_019776 [Characodon lateralis]|uniref:HTH psq-type domain-containing protein n=1 Tax=Characodon lateralis TaxID=208331 RepID=A0ABU7EB41_9TELE|nr:hypothetical protein [Characodon lateralis]